MTDLARKPGTLSVAQAKIDETMAVDSTAFPEREPAEAMVPVKVLRGYWPKGTPSDIEFGDVELPNPHARLVEGDKPTDPKRLKILPDALCMMPEAEAQAAADNGIVRILTAKGYRDAQEAAAIAPPPPSPRTTIIQKTA